MLTYRIRRGDKLSDVAALHGVSVSDVVAANPHKPRLQLQSGAVVFASLGSGEDIAVPCNALGALGISAQDVYASMSPYAPFAAGTVMDAGYAKCTEQTTACATGRLAQDLLVGAMNGNLPSTNQVASEVGAIAGGAAGAEFGPIGIALGSVIGGAVGGAIGSLISGDDGGCDINCYALKTADQLQGKLCVSTVTGQVSPTCRQQIIEAALQDGVLMFAGSSLVDKSWVAPLNADLVKYKIPHAPLDGHESSVEIMGPASQVFKARLADAAAQVRYADDVLWAQKVVADANNMAAEWGPRCPSCDPGCLLSVKGYSVGYALSANPYHETPSALVGGIASGGAEYFLGGLIATSTKLNPCPTNATLTAGCLALGNGSWYEPATQQCVGGHPTNGAYLTCHGVCAAASMMAQMAGSKPGAKPFDQIMADADACEAACMATHPDLVPGARCAMGESGYGVTDAAGQCVQPFAYAGDDCVTATGAVGTYSRDVAAADPNACGVVTPPMTLMPADGEGGLSRITFTSSHAVAYEPTAEPTPEPSSHRIWWIALGVVGVAAAGWTGYRIYKKQPVVPPKATAYVKAIPAKVKGVFKKK